MTFAMVLAFVNSLFWWRCGPGTNRTSSAAGTGGVINPHPGRLQRSCNAGSISSNSKVNPSSSNRRGTQ